jgi:hypothetical protein
MCIYELNPVIKILIFKDLCTKYKINKKVNKNDKPNFI